MEQDNKISVMVVDDSLIYRTILRELINEDPEMKVVTQSVNGKLAIPRIRHYKPDLIILDQQMPDMTGLQLLELIRKESSETGVVMLSAFTKKGAQVTVQALELGVLDFFTKPTGGGPEAVTAFIKNEFIPHLKKLFRRSKLGKNSREGGEVAATPKRNVREMVGSFHVAAIGISTGGPSALQQLMPGFNKNIGGAILIVQHMPPVFTKQLAESLNRTSAIKVVEGEENMPVEPGVAYIAPGGKHMVVRSGKEGGIIKILDLPAENNCKPSVNVLFRSVAEVYGRHALGVIMTGMGNDGYEGMKMMKSAGAYLLAQNEASCLVFGMPAQPIREGLVDEAMDIPSLASRINFMLGVNRNGA